MACLWEAESMTHPVAIALFSVCTSIILTAMFTVLHIVMEDVIAETWVKRLKLAAFLMLDAFIVSLALTAIISLYYLLPSVVVEVIYCSGHTC